MVSAFGGPMDKNRSESYSLRADELRAIAAEIQSDQYRQFLITVAADYERMAECAAFVIACQERLDVVSDHLDSAQIRGTTAANGGNSACHCRSMADDAARLGSLAEGLSREAWLQLSERWKALAKSLDPIAAE